MHSISIDSNDHWHPISGCGSRRCPEEQMSLAAEIFIEHDHFDEDTSVQHADGILLNRHVWKQRQLIPPTAIPADALGEDCCDLGPHISLAAQAQADDGLGGELYFDDGSSAHQREYEFLQGHVAQAYHAYQLQYSSWPQANLNDWQKVEALARYATRWKMRTAQVYASFHPVDVLFHSSYCTGAANILQALAMVAGFETRFIAISNHSTIEINVNGRWIWADNIVANGGVTPNTFNYAEMTGDPLAVPSFTDMQRDFYNSATARYRSPYSLSARYYWHFMSGEAKGRGQRDDISDGYGLSVPYDPSCAAGLYPELKQHRFFANKGWGPCVNIAEKGSLIRAQFSLEPGARLRKIFYISTCDDNPIKRGIVKIRLAASCDPTQLNCTVDGHTLQVSGIGTRFQEPCLECIIDASLLRPGEHELVISAVGAPVQCILYPDPITPYYHPYSEKTLKLDDRCFSVEPCLAPAVLERLREPLLT